MAEEEKRKKEEQRKAEEERKKSDEKRRKAEEREKRLKIEEKKKQEEEEKRRAAEEEEQQRIEEEKRRIEEEKRREEDKKREEERQAEEEKSREEDDKSEDEFSLLALTKPHKRFQYSDYRSGKYQEKEQKKEEEKKRKEEEERKKAEAESKRQEEQDKKKSEDSFAKLEHLIHPSPSLVPEPRTPMLTKAAKKDIPSMIADDFAQEIFQDAKPSLRRGKMIPCPLCGVEYALASNLEKHIDRDHREEGAEDEGRGRRKRRGASAAISKKRKRKSEDEEDEGVKKSRTEATEEASLVAPPAVVEESVSQQAETEETEDKLTEYEIFQKLQMKEQKADRKRVECLECGLHIPTNTIKRHQQKHEKDAERAKLLAENPSLAIPPPKVVSPKKKVTCPECGKELPPNTLKRHIAKHKKTKEQTKALGTPNDQGLADERTPNDQGLAD